MIIYMLSLFVWLFIAINTKKVIKNAVTENRTRAKAMATLHSTTKLLQLIWWLCGQIGHMLDHAKLIAIFSYDYWFCDSAWFCIYIF